MPDPREQEPRKNVSAGHGQRDSHPDSKLNDTLNKIPGDAFPGPRDDTARPREIGGPKGPEPTRYGDWQRAGRCIDF